MGDKVKNQNLVMLKFVPDIIIDCKRHKYTNNVLKPKLKPLYRARNPIFWKSKQFHYRLKVLILNVRIDNIIGLAQTILSVKFFIS